MTEPRWKDIAHIREQIARGTYVTEGRLRMAADAFLRAVATPYARCEVCEKPSTRACGGLDVPMEGYCDEHAPYHELVCRDFQAGRSRWWHVYPDGRAVPEATDG